MVRIADVLTLFAVTVAPGITAPVLSVTVPAIVPVSACDHAGWPQRATAATSIRTTNNLLFITRLLGPASAGFDLTGRDDSPHCNENQYGYVPYGKLIPIGICK